MGAGEKTQNILTH